MNARRAFTLWELLCVLFVIVLLVALLMPALTRVRRYSTSHICVAYLRLYSAAGQLYLNDHGGAFPDGAREWLYASASNSHAHPLGCRWHDQAMAPSGEVMSSSEEFRGKMWAYISGTTVGPCPEFRRFARSRGCENPNHNRRLEIRPQYCYAMNGYLGAPGDGGVSRVSQVRDPGGVFFFGEENSWSLRPDHPKFPARWLSAPLSTRGLDDTVLLIRPTPMANDCFATYHQAPSGDLSRGSANVVFVDGHVASIRAEDQLRRAMHGGESHLGPAGNLTWAWANRSPPPGGWEAQ